jgi:hypothetical protein
MNSDQNSLLNLVFKETQQDGPELLYGMEKLLERYLF